MRVAILSFSLLLLGLGVPPGRVRSAEPERIPLNVLYLGRQKAEKRTAAFLDFLTARFRKCTGATRDDFQPHMLSQTDVVLIDWSQQERVSSNYPSPVGPLENWQTPTVLLGSAGLIMAGPWSVIGGAG